MFGNGGSPTGGLTDLDKLVALAQVVTDPKKLEQVKIDLDQRHKKATEAEKVVDDKLITLTNKEKDDIMREEKLNNSHVALISLQNMHETKKKKLAEELASLKKEKEEHAKDKAALAQEREDFKAGSEKLVAEINDRTNQASTAIAMAHQELEMKQKEYTARIEKLEQEENAFKARLDSFNALLGKI